MALPHLLGHPRCLLLPQTWCQHALHPLGPTQDRFAAVGGTHWIYDPVENTKNT